MSLEEKDYRKRLIDDKIDRYLKIVIFIQKKF